MATAIEERRSVAVNTLDELSALAEKLFKGGMRPAWADRPECLVAAILAGGEIGLGPIQSINNIMIVGGKATVWGDTALALCRASGLLTSIDEGVKGEGDTRRGWCELVREKENPVKREFTVAEAKAAKLWEKKGPWQQYPDRMLTNRARSLAIRFAFPDLLSGLSIAGEQQEEVEAAEFTVTQVKETSQAGHPPASPTTPPAPAGTPALPAPSEVQSAIATLRPQWYATLNLADDQLKNAWVALLQSRYGSHVTTIAGLELQKLVDLRAHLEHQVSLAHVFYEKTKEGEPANNATATTAA